MFWNWNGRAYFILRNLLRAPCAVNHTRFTCCCGEITLRIYTPKLRFDDILWDFLFVAFGKEILNSLRVSFQSFKAQCEINWFMGEEVIDIGFVWRISHVKNSILWPFCWGLFVWDSHSNYSNLFWENLDMT